MRGLRRQNRSVQARDRVEMRVLVREFLDARLLLDQPLFIERRLLIVDPRSRDIREFGGGVPIDLPFVRRLVNCRLLRVEIDSELFRERSASIAPCSKATLFVDHVVASAALRGLKVPKARRVGVRRRLTVSAPVSSLTGFFCGRRRSGVS